MPGWFEGGRQPLRHRQLSRPSPAPIGQTSYFAFHDDDELGPRILERIAKHTGLTSTDL